MQRLHRANGLTQTQFNVLRILYRAGNSGVSCQDVSDGLISRDPDVTGLVDRLEQKGLVERVRDPEDRRRVLVFLTAAGAELTERLTPLGVARHRAQFGHLSAAELRELNRLLAKVLEHPSAAPPGSSQEKGTVD
ncbi:MAG: MarR family transcriptional regulator [marine benthic group bacterium]|nr:MarR family transcriptional regulator [Gemmatimonadota bacterium]